MEDNKKDLEGAIAVSYEEDFTPEDSDSAKTSAKLHDITFPVQYYSANTLKEQGFSSSLSLNLVG